VKPRILGFVDNTHTPATELFDDAIMEDGLLEEWLEVRHQALILGWSQKTSQRAGASRWLSPGSASFRNPTA
jgi:hypothetical protein